MRTLVLTALFGFALGIVPAHAEVVIKLRPPVSIREHRTVRPSRDHVCDIIARRKRITGRRPVGTATPRPCEMVAPDTRRHDGYVYTEGRWR
jgi:hypothetical protein